MKEVVKELTPSKKKKIWNSYSDETKAALKHALEVFKAEKFEIKQY